MAEENVEVVYKDAPNDNVDVSKVTESSKEEVTEQQQTTEKQGEEGSQEGQEGQSELPESAQEALVNQISELGFDVDEIDQYLDAHGVIPPELYEAFVQEHGLFVADLMKEKIENAQKEYVNTQKENDSRLYKTLEEAFQGITEQTGEETWKELKQWAGKNLSDQKAELNALLAEGGLQAELALKYIVNKFKESEDFTQPATLESGDDFSNDYKVVPLSKQAYNEKLNELLNKGYSYESIEVAQLQRQRMKAIRRGQ